MSKTFNAMYKVNSECRKMQGAIISELDVDPDTSEGALRDLFREFILEHYRQHFYCEGQNEEEFIAWARSLREKRAA